MINEKNDKFYGKFIKKSFDDKKKQKSYFQNSSAAEKNKKEHSSSCHIETDADIENLFPMFNPDNLSKEAVNVLENFDNFLQKIRPLNQKQLMKLSKNIRELSGLLTDEREFRRAGYMNGTEELSAYTYYFAWWNLIRLTRLFSSLNKNSFCFKDGDFCLDAGSGPLTVVTALWIACPFLRNIKLNWYCMDISQGALALGEDIFLSIAARLPPPDAKAQAHWNIIRVKGKIGTSIRQKVSFISCANMFNELFQFCKEKINVCADSQISQLLSYGQEKVSVFIAEPGIPEYSHFINVMRNHFLEKGFSVISPCPHAGMCPMDGYNARNGGKSKWCNFSFFTENAPIKLLKLSAEAGIPKKRAVISYLFVSNKSPIYTYLKNRLPVRIVSEPIRLPENRTGYYGCSKNGLILAVNTSKKNIFSGDLINFRMKKDFKNLKNDKKTNAKEIAF